MNAPATKAKEPASPRLDAHMRRVDARERLVEIAHRIADRCFAEGDPLMIANEAIASLRTIADAQTERR